MSYCKVIMLINITDYNLISEEIKKLNVPGVTVSHVQGYGDYANHFLQLGLCDSLKVEIYTSIEQADEIAQVLADLSMSMTEGGGLVAIEPVSKLLNVKKLAEK